MNHSLNKKNNRIKTLKVFKMSAFKQTNIQYTQEIEKTLFNWTKQDKTFQHVLSCFVRLKSVLLISFFLFVLFWVFSERQQSTLFQIFFNQTNKQNREMEKIKTQKEQEECSTTLIFFLFFFFFFLLRTQQHIVTIFGKTSFFQSPNTHTGVDVI